MAEENQDQQQGEQQEEQVETVAKADYDNVVAELEEVKGKLSTEPTEEEVTMQEKQQELFDKEVALELKSAGLEQFKDVVKVSDNDELKETIKSLNKIVNEIKVSTGYVPKDHAQDDEYSKHEKENNTQGMIATKLANLFK